MKKVVIGVIIAVAALIGILFVINKNKAKNQAQTEIVAVKNAAVSVRADVADYREVNAAYVSNGVFAPKQEVMISADVPGKVETVLVQEGAVVSAGQTLAIIKSDKQDVGVLNAKAAYDNAKVELARFESSFATGGVTQQQLDGVRLQYQNAKNNLRSAQINANDVNIKASFSGIVNKKNIEPGSYVNPGQQLFEVVNIATLKLKVNVDEKNVTRIKKGSQVKVTSTVLPNESWTGVVTFIAPKADASLNFPVELEIQGKGENLKAGMYGTAEFGGEGLQNIFTVPRTAFVGNVSSNQIFVIKNGKAVLTNVVSGRNFGDYVEILSGLAQGDQVVTTGQINLANDTPVEIIK